MSRGGRSRVLLLSTVLLLAVTGTTFAGVAAGATNVSITPDDDTAGATNVTYTADGNVQLGSQDTLQYVDVHLDSADVSNVGTGDISLFIDGTEYTDGFTEFSASGGTVEFKLSNSRSVSDGDSVRVVVADVTNPDSDFTANVTLHDTGDAQWQEYTDTVTIDDAASMDYSNLQFDAATAGNDTTVTVGENLTVSATVANTGGSNGTYNASLKVDGAVRQYRNGTLAAGSSTTVSFVTNFSSTGGYDATVETLSATEVTVTDPVDIDGGSATPATVEPGTTVNNQKVSVVVANVSQDGDTDTHYVEFPDALSSGLSVNGADANATGITSSAELVEGYDDDGLDDTVRFATSGDGGGDIDLNLTVDVSVDYPDGDATYGIDARTEDSSGGVATQSDVATVTADGVIDDYTVTNPSGREVDVSFNSSIRLADIGVEIANTSGDTVTTLSEGDFTETNVSGTWRYEAAHTLAQDGNYDITLTTAVDDDGTDHADGQTASVSVGEAVTIIGGSADPATVSPGTTVNNQRITVTLSGVSADGNTDSHYVELPDALSSGLSVNYATVNGSASIAQSAELVEGYDDDGTDETVRFQTDTDAGDTVSLTVTVDVSVDYPDTAATYGIDARVEDSDTGIDERTDVTTIEATTTTAPIVTDYAATNPVDRDVQVTFDSSQQLATITVNLTDGSGSSVTTLTENDFTETDDGGTWHYTATYTVAADGDYTATLTEAVDADGNDGGGASDSVTVDTAPATIIGGSATPGQVAPGETISNQQVRVRFATVSADGDTDWHYVEFPDMIAENHTLSVNGADANATSITSSAELVEGYDDDGVDDTVRFATSSDAGGDVDLAVTVDVTISTCSCMETTYTVDARLVDSESGAVSQRGVASIDAVEPDGDGGGGGGGGGNYEDVREALGPGLSVELFDIAARSQDVNVIVETSLLADNLRVDIDGATDVTLDREAFTRSTEGGNYVYVANVSEGRPGTFEATLEMAATESGDGETGRTDSVVVEPTDAISPNAVAAPPTTGSGDSIHTLTVPVASDASVTGESLRRVTVDYGDGFLVNGGSVSSVSDDQNVAHLSVIAPDGSVESSLGETDAVSVDIVSGEVRLDLSDVDGSRIPTLTVGDRVLIRLRPVTNPATAGNYSADVTLVSAARDGETVETSLYIRNESTLGAVDTAFVGPHEDRASLDFFAPTVIESVTIDSWTHAIGSTRVRTLADRPNGIDRLPGEPVTMLVINRPDPIEGAAATITVTVSTAALDGTADDLRLTRYDTRTDRWVRPDTRIVDTGDGTVTLEATVSETSMFSVVGDGAAERGTATARPDRTIRPTPTATPTPTRSSSPGFGVGAAVAALFGAALLAARRRE